MEGQRLEHPLQDGRRKKVHREHFRYGKTKRVTEGDGGERFTG